MERRRRHSSGWSRVYFCIGEWAVERGAPAYRLRRERSLCGRRADSTPAHWQATVARLRLLDGHRQLWDPIFDNWLLGSHRVGAVLDELVPLIPAQLPPDLQEEFQVAIQMTAVGVLAYDFFTSAIFASHQAFEFALERRYVELTETPVRGDYKELLSRSLARGLIDQATHERLNSARELRNSFVHEKNRMRLTPAGCVSFVRAMLEVAAVLWPPPAPTDPSRLVLIPAPPRSGSR
jgi:hypothetical protein